MVDTGRFNALIESIKSWASKEPQIAAILLVGSYARGEAAEESDVDLILLSDQRSAFLTDTTWIQRFGYVERKAVEDWGGVTSLRIWYEKSLEVEFGFAMESWASQPLDPGTKRLLLDGYKVIADRAGLFNNLDLRG